ncbi:MAG: cation:proton antiporter [Chitinophagales bacterium]|nr:cation:proton antiporter [Chitinophagales bacterium]
MPAIITDLALIMVIAGITTIVFKRLKQPVVLGYILAGLLVVPNTPFLPSVKDSNSISVWAEIGIIFLLFNLGLDFSVKKLIKIAPTVAPIGIFEVSMMVITGFLVGSVMGWNQLDKVFLGGIIACSSTTIIIRTIEELRLKTKKYTDLVMGVLIIEDIVAVLLLVLLSTISVSQNFEGMDLLYVAMRLVFFLILWFVVGILLIPTMLNKLRVYLGNETILIVALGLCLGMVVMATSVGFSSALGAFLMGSILAETNFVHQIEEQLKSLKDLFGAVFFVSVGMMIDPVMLWENIGLVLILAMTVILGKTIFVSTGMLVSGQPLKASIQSGMTMGQIGEFSFIIATLGLSLGVISKVLYPVAVGVSVLTIFLTPYMIKFSEPFYEFLNKHLPEKWLSAIENYSESTQHVSEENEWKKLVQSYLTVILINAVIAVGIILLGYHIILPIEHQYIRNGRLNDFMFFLVILFFILPFLWGILNRRIQPELYREIWNRNNFTRGPLISLKLLRVFVALAVLTYLIAKIVSVNIALALALLIIFIGISVYSKNIKEYYNLIEDRFYFNLNKQEIIQRQRAEKLRGLLPWDTHFADMRVSPSSILVGRTLQSLSLREKYDVNITIIDREYEKIYVPGKHQVVLAGDLLTLIGDDEQLEKVRKLVETSPKIKSQSHEKIELGKITIKEGDFVIGKSIEDCDIRNRTHGMVIGIEKGDGTRDLNPSSNRVLEADDIIWIVGNLQLINDFAKELKATNPLNTTENIKVENKI